VGLKLQDYFKFSQVKEEETRHEHTQVNIFVQHMRRRDFDKATNTLHLQTPSYCPKIYWKKRKVPACWHIYQNRVISSAGSLVLFILNQFVTTGPFILFQFILLKQFLPLNQLSKSTT